MAINRVFLAGNIVREPELKMAGDTPLLKFSLAVNDRKKQGDEWVEVPNYFDVLVWGKRAESLSRFLEKGSKVAISGKLRWSQWETDDGKRSKVEIIADDVEFMSKRQEANDKQGADGELFTEDIPFF